MRLPRGGGGLLGGGGDEVGIMPVFFVGQIVSHHLVIFRLLVHIINLLVLNFLYLSYYTIFKSISIIIGEGSENSSIHRRRRPGMRGGGSK